MPQAKIKKFKTSAKKSKVFPTNNKEPGKKILYPLAILTIVFSLAFSVYTISQATKPLTDKEIGACKVDSDCIEVPDGCCSCAMGGQSTAINKNYKGYMAEKRAAECRDFACLTVYVCNDEIAPRCISGQCLLKSDIPPR